MARYAYPEIDRLPEPLASEIRGRVGPGRGNVWRMLCWTPNTAEKFIAYSECIRNGNDIPPKIRELMILRVGHLCSAPYEVHHHERIGRSVGVTETAISAAAIGPDALGIDGAEKFALSLADELVNQKTLSRPAFEQAIASYGVRTATDMILLIGFYTMASMFLNSFGVDIENAQGPA